MSKNITIREITNVNSFEPLREKWSSLIESSPTQDAFLTWEWFYAWFTSYGKNAKPIIVTVWEDENLVGVAPFALLSQRKYGFNFRVLRTLSAPQCDVGGFLVKNGRTQVLDIIASWLISQQNRWDLLELNQFLRNSTETQSILNLLQENKFNIQEKTNKHFYICYDGGWDEYCSRLGKNFRKHLRKNERRIEETGEYEVKRFNGKAVTWNVIEDIMEINRHATYPYICNSIEDQKLHKTLIQVMSEKNWFEVYILFIQGKPVAYEYGFLYKGRMEDWRVGYDRRNNLNFSPGVYLTTQVMKTGFTEGQKEINFLRGDEGYKNDWGPLHREFLHIKAASQSSFLAALAFIWLPGLKQRVEQLSMPHTNDE